MSAFPSFVLQLIPTRPIYESTVNRMLRSSSTKNRWDCCHSSPGSSSSVSARRHKKLVLINAMAVRTPATKASPEGHQHAPNKTKDEADVMTTEDDGGGCYKEEGRRPRRGATGRCAHARTVFLDLLPSDNSLSSSTKAFLCFSDSPVKQEII